MVIGLCFGDCYTAVNTPVLVLLWFILSSFRLSHKLTVHNIYVREWSCTFQSFLSWSLKAHTLLDAHLHNAIKSLYTTKNELTYFRSFIHWHLLRTNKLFIIISYKLIYGYWPSGYASHNVHHQRITKPLLPFVMDVLAVLYTCVMSGYECGLVSRCVFRQ